ncbi:MAG: adenylate/guanylate cyclase domain-containing protein [Acidimicrobiia bacterium]|nr:adenylate/guanylate cyclase domain-containing protein [Acidimicrobiia bacterium]
MEGAIGRVVNLGATDQSATDVRRIQTINLIALFGMFFNLLYTVWLACIDASELWPVMATNGVYVVVTALVLVLNAAGHTSAAMWLLVIGSWFDLVFATLLVGPPVFLFLLVLPITVALVAREGDLWTQGAFVALSTALVLLVVLVEPETADAIRGTSTETVMTVLSAICTALFIGIVAVYFKQVADTAEAEMVVANERSEQLLLNILPAEIADRLKAGEEGIADRFESATVLFADVVDFTPLSASMSADELVSLLDEIFRSLDGLVGALGLEKIKTVGDAYMVASGVPEWRPDHAEAMAELALGIRSHTEEEVFGGRRVQVRIGMHSGPVVAGIIGDRKFSYDLWGDTVNTASRLESHGVPGEIQISVETKDLISDSYRCERRGEVELKGKGPAETWFLRERR